MSPPLSTVDTRFLRSPPPHAPEAEEDEAAAAAAAAACSHCATAVKAEMASPSFSASSSAEPDRAASLSGRGGGGGGRLTPFLGAPPSAEAALAAWLCARERFLGSRFRSGVWARFFTEGDGVGRREGCGRCESGAGRGGAWLGGDGVGVGGEGATRASSWSEELEAQVLQFHMETTDQPARSKTSIQATRRTFCSVLRHCQLPGMLITKCLPPAP